MALLHKMLIARQSNIQPEANDPRVRILLEEFKPAADDISFALLQGKSLLFAIQDIGLDKVPEIYREIIKPKDLVPMQSLSDPFR